MRHSKELKSLAREALAGHYGLMVGAYVVISLISTVLLMPFTRLAESGNAGSNVIYVLATLVVSLLTIVLNAGYLKISFHLAKKEPVSLGLIFSQFKKRPDRFIGSTLLFMLIVFLACIPGIIALVAEFAVIGLNGEEHLAALIAVVVVTYILFLILILFVTFRFQFYLYFLVDHEDMGAIESLKASNQMMKGKMKRILYLTLSFIPMSLLGMLSFGIGMLWIQPYINQTLTFFYLDATGEYDRMLEEEAKLHEEEPVYGPEYYA